MDTYGMTFRDSNETITIDADFYTINNGFVRFFEDSASLGQCEFAAYASDNVLQVVKQKEYTEKEILQQLKGGSE